MRTIFVTIFFTVLSVFCLSYQEAVDAKNTPVAPSKPIRMDKGTKPVTFDHNDHASFECTTCHHPVKRDGGKIEYKKCSSSGCHDVLGRNKDPMSYYQVMHNKTPSEGHSTCLACHTQTAAKEPEKRKALTACLGSSCHPAAPKAN